MDTQTTTAGQAVIDAAREYAGSRLAFYDATIAAEIGEDEEVNVTIAYEQMRSAEVALMQSVDAYNKAAAS